MRRALLLLLPLPLLLSGCIPLMVAGGTTTGVSLAENRSLGRKLDDNVIYADITNKYAHADFQNLMSHVTVSVRFGRVMLTGQVAVQDTAQKAVQLAWKARGVLEVINEIVVSPDPDFTDMANDTLVKKNLQGRILITKDVWEINYSIDVVNGTAYILGRTHDREELNRVMNIARTTKGVHRVVNYLQVASELPDPSLTPSAPPTTATSPGQSLPSTQQMPETQQAPAPYANGTNTVAAPDTIESAPLPPSRR